MSIWYYMGKGQTCREAGTESHGGGQGFDLKRFVARQWIVCGSDPCHPAGLPECKLSAYRHLFSVDTNFAPFCDGVLKVSS